MCRLYIVVCEYMKEVLNIAKDVREKIARGEREGREVWRGRGGRERDIVCTYVSKLTLMVQQSSSSDWSINWNTPEVRVDHWMANEASNKLNAMLPNPYRLRKVIRNPNPIKIITCTS